MQFSRPLPWSSALLLAVLAPAALLAQAPSPESVVTRYRAARLATMEVSATAATVDTLLALLTDSVVYEHPQAGARIVGRNSIGAGIRSFLGSTRRPRIAVLRQLVTGSAVAAEERVSFEIRGRTGEWERRTRTQLSVYLVEGARVSQELEYWVRAP